jgi:hypothetical protein
LDKSLLENKEYIEDEHGYPVLFAVPQTQRRRPLKEENLPEIVTPDGTSGPAEWGRYHDAVREAARSFDNPQEGDIHHFLQARARTPERVDTPAFHEAVKRQRMADLVDILDHHMRHAGSLPRGHRMVRVQAPKGYLRRALRQSSPEDLAHLRHRLCAIGHSQQHVDQHLSSRVMGDIWDQATSYEIRMADDEFDGITFDDSDSDFSWADEHFEFSPTINVYVDSKSPEASE